MKNNILLLIDDLKIVKKAKKVPNVTFLFPLKDFSIGFKNTFALDEIKEEGYLFLNRILDNAGIEQFKNIISRIPSNIKGIVFDDLGILNVLLKSNLNLTKILFLNHFNCNYESINNFLEYVDSVVVSPDITIKEIDEIIAKTNKPLVLYTFGHVNIMYSRRTLITNYNNYFNRNVPNIASLEENVSKTKFKIMENPYGTVIYTEKPFNGLELLNRKCLFNLINTYKYLSEKETIFKLKGEEK